MRQGVQDFLAALEARLRRISHRVEIVDYARSLRFPMLPVAVGRPVAREATRGAAPEAIALDLDRRPAQAGRRLH